MGLSTVPLSLCEDPRLLVHSALKGLREAACSGSRSRNLESGCNVLSVFDRAAHWQVQRLQAAGSLFPRISFFIDHF